MKKQNRHKRQEEARETKAGGPASKLLEMEVIVICRFTYKGWRLQDDHFGEGRRTSKPGQSSIGRDG